MVLARVMVLTRVRVLTCAMVLNLRIRKKLFPGTTTQYAKDLHFIFSPSEPRQNFDQKMKSKILILKSNSVFLNMPLALQNSDLRRCQLNGTTVCF